MRQAIILSLFFWTSCFNLFSQDVIAVGVYTGETSQTTIIENSLCPDNNHPHAIDLGLPSGTKWSCCNVDAIKPEDYGGYYAWGEIEEQKAYDWTTYIHCNGSWESCKEIGSPISGTKYDVAHMKWGDDTLVDVIMVIPFAQSQNRPDL